MQKGALFQLPRRAPLQDKVTCKDCENYLYGIHLRSCRIIRIIGIKCIWGCQ